MSKRLPRFPCGICKGSTGPGSIACSFCDRWFHTIQCVNMTSSELEEFDDSEIEYNCPHCSRNASNFDHLYDVLKRVARKGEQFLREKIETKMLSSFCTLDTKLHVGRPGDSYRIDNVALDLLRKYAPSTKMIPLYASPDGHCLFHSMSILLCRNESLSTELRVRCLIEMVKNEEWYRNQHKEDDLQLISGTFWESVYDCATGGYSHPYAIHAIASVLEKEIVSVYPPVNGMLDSAVRILSCSFKPRLTKNKKIEKVYVMWTSVEEPEPEKTWTPNHFVPLVQIEQDNVCMVGDLPKSSNFDPSPEGKCIFNSLYSLSLNLIT